MKKILITGCLLAVAGSVYAKPDQQAYDDCVLANVSKAEESAAASIMTNACHRLHMDNFMISEKDQAYFQCLLDYLPEVKKRSLTMQVKQTCDSKHRSLFN